MSEVRGPLRIAQVAGKMVGGGVDSFLMNYFRHVDPKRVVFDFIADDDSTLIHEDEILERGGRVFRVAPYQNLPAYIRDLRKLCRQEQWLIMHSHLNSLSVFPLSVAAHEGIPVRIAHSHSFVRPGEPARNLLKSVLRTQSRRFATSRFACSKDAGEWLFGRGVDFDVVPNAIDLQRFHFDDLRRAEMRQQCGIADSTFVVGHVGRFVAAKNHSFILEIFRDLLKVRPDSCLILVGEGSLKEEILQRANGIGVRERVRFIRQQENIQDWYQMFDAFALPSLYEGLSLVCVEAQCARLPCVVSTNVPREVNASGEVQFLPLGGTDPWVEALVRVEGRTAPSQHELKFYDIRHAAPELVDRYESLVERI